MARARARVVVRAPGDARSPRRLAAVYVEQLFGLYTFDIPIRGSTTPGPSLLILYGDNGTGKTTILNLVYHLLAREDNLGHRSYLAKVPFRRLRVSLTDGSVVEASRDGDDLVGSYRLRVQRHGRFVAQAKAVATADLAVRTKRDGTPAEQAAWEGFIHAIADLDLTFFMLPADRRVERPLEPGVTVAPRDIDIEYWRTLTFVNTEGRDGGEGDLRLEETIDQLEKWIRDEALKGANLGEASANTVYVDVAKRIAQPRRQAQQDDAAVERISQSLLDLEYRSRPFAALGLVSAPDLGDVAAALDKAQGDRRQLIANVIAPYVDSLRARLDNLQDIQELVSLFLDRINSFYRNKSVSYHVGTGIAIVTPDGKTIAPLALSSGERQLFGLLGRVLIARRSATVFLIDEPEISLNVKWQRLLVDTLLELVRGTDVQFVLATHSLELLATHRNSVHRLWASPSDERAG